MNDVEKQHNQANDLQTRIQSNLKSARLLSFGDVQLAFRKWEEPTALKKLHELALKRLQKEIL